MKKEIKCRCRYCGSVAYMMTRVKDARKIPRSDKRFTCNQCMIDYFGDNDMWQPVLIKPKIRF